MGKAKAKREGKNVFYIVIIIILVSASIFLIGNIYTQSNNATAPNTNLSAEEQIIQELANSPDVHSYANYTAFVKLLTEEDLQQFRQQQPAVYNGVPAGSYRVIYQGPEDALLVIYDFDKKEILKIFVVQTLVI